MDFTTSNDGSAIAYDTIGDGPPIVLLAGALCTRGVTRPLADALGTQVRVLNPDRRGRGDSTDASGDPWTLEREIEDVAALIQAAGGTASLYGHSSGAGLALQCAAAAVPVDRLVLYVPPYNTGPASGPESREFYEQLLPLLRETRHVDAVALFLGGMGMPEEVAREAATGLQDVAPPLAYDSAAMGRRRRWARPRGAVVVRAGPHAGARRRCRPPVHGRRRPQPGVRYPPGHVRAPRGPEPRRSGRGGCSPDPGIPRFVTARCPDAHLG